MAGKKILVADDSLTIQKVIRLALSGDGYEIQTVSDGKEALEQASLFRPDICIIDVSLPKYDAYQVREHFIMKPDLKNIPVILMSSAFEKVDETRAQKLGFAGHLIKPFDPSHLRSTLLSVSSHVPENDPVMATINEPVTDSVSSRNTIQFEPPTPSSFQDLPPLNPDFHRGMDDIQEMAKNTFELSGLDQQDWGMIEPGKMEDPFKESNFQGTFTPQKEVSHFDLNEVSNMPGFQGPPPTQNALTITPEELEIMVKSEVERILAEMQNDLRQRVVDEVNNFTQTMIPGLAERIIRDEIHKLLLNPPI
jgi:CheY-like chemotaxis protein